MVTSSMNLLTDPFQPIEVSNLRNSSNMEEEDTSTDDDLWNMLVEDGEDEDEESEEKLRISNTLGLVESDIASTLAVKKSSSDTTDLSAVHDMMKDCEGLRLVPCEGSSTENCTRNSNVHSVQVDPNQSTQNITLQLQTLCNRLLQQNMVLKHLLQQKQNQEILKNNHTGDQASFPLNLQTALNINNNSSDYTSISRNHSNNNYSLPSSVVPGTDDRFVNSALSSALAIHTMLSSARIPPLTSVTAAGEGQISQEQTKPCAAVLPKTATSSLNPQRYRDGSGQQRTSSLKELGHSKQLSVPQETQAAAAANSVDHWSPLSTLIMSNQLFGSSETSEAAATMRALMNHEENKEQRQRSAANIDDSFPAKLYSILDKAEENGYSSIVSFSNDGRCFRVHDRPQFVQEILPRYFKQSSFASFHRQLNCYGFECLHAGKSRTAFFHPSFCRGFKRESISIPRRKQQRSRRRRRPSSGRKLL